MPRSLRGKILILSPSNVILWAGTAPKASRIWRKRRDIPSNLPALPSLFSAPLSLDFHTNVHVHHISAATGAGRVPPFPAHPPFDAAAVFPGNVDVDEGLIVVAAVPAAAAASLCSHGSHDVSGPTLSGRRRRGRRRWAAAARRGRRPPGRG